jgi:hypothetical protein
VRRMLTRGEVYFARAPEFNDPFELRPRWVWRGRNSAELRKIFRDEALEDARGNRNQKRALVARALKNATPDMIRRNQSAYHKVLETKVDIFCMSGTKKLYSCGRITRSLTQVFASTSTQHGCHSALRWL